MGGSNHKTIAFLTLGCKLNYAETSTYERGFALAGLEIVPWQAKADIYLINTCSVTATSDAKSRNLVRKVLRVNPSAIVVVTGCSAELRRSELEAIDGVARVFGCREKSLVVTETLALAGIGADVTPLAHTQAAPDRATAAGKEESSLQKEDACIFAAYSSGERTRSFLKVQDGCDNYCAYCTVPYARGASRSVPIAECVRNAREIAALGVKEIVLTGVNTGDFGRGTGETFLGLLQALEEVQGIERYRISSIEPNLITEEIIDWIASGTKFQPHFHIPLQSGSDTLLASMGRHYDTAFFESRIEYIRSRMESPGSLRVFFGIDVMAGLPGESEALFLETLEFLKRIRPAFIHVFPYSRRPGTRAAMMPGQVAEEARKERVAELERLCERLHSEFCEAHRGMRAPVLFESTRRGGMMEGYSSNYIRVSRPWDAALSGKIIEATL